MGMYVRCVVAWRAVARSIYFVNRTLDYIWFNYKELSVRKVLKPLSDVEIAKHQSLPSVEFSSDHAALACDLKFIK